MTLFERIALLLLIANFCLGVKARFWKETHGKLESKLEKLSFFHGSQEQLFQFCPEREPHFLHILDSDYLLFKMFQKMSESYNLDIFKHFSKFAPFPS